LAHLEAQLRMAASQPGAGNDLLTYLRRNGGISRLHELVEGGNPCRITVMGRAIPATELHQMYPIPWIVDSAPSFVPVVLGGFPITVQGQRWHYAGLILFVKDGWIMQFSEAISR
jgi:hypothetical protein